VGPRFLPRSAAPTELRLWNWITLALLALFIVAGALSAPRWVAALILYAGGAVQVVFGGLATINRRGFADRLAAYYARRPAMLGGFILNHHSLSWRLQGFSMVVAGIALAAVTARFLR
jgi:hypothetical protein